MKNNVKRSTSRQPEVASISDISPISSDNLISQKNREAAPRCGSKPPRRVLDPVQAGELLGFDEKTIKRWASIGYLPSHPVGLGKKKYWRFFEDELIDWLMDQKNGAFAA